MAPPSIHSSGKYYEAIENGYTPENVTILPDWVLQECSENTPIQKTDSVTVVQYQKINKKNNIDWKTFLEEKNGEGTRNDRTTKYAGKIVSGLAPELLDTA